MDGEGNRIKGAHVSVRGIRHNITTGDNKTSLVILPTFMLFSYWLISMTQSEVSHLNHGLVVVVSQLYDNKN